MYPKHTLCIGDIHGALLALKQVIHRAKIDFNKDKVIFLGDYVDGWSESAELIEFLIDIKENSKQEHVFLLGNHDLWVLEWLEYGSMPEIWTRQGGEATLDSYMKNADDKKINIKNHRKFFNSLHNYFIDNDNRAYVHGGYKSKKGLGHEDNINYLWNRSLWYDQDKERLSHYKDVFIGHTSIGANGKMNYGNNLWNIDTGAGWEGKLTVIDVHTKQYWQSDFVKNLYPLDKGRR